MPAGSSTHTTSHPPNGQRFIDYAEGCVNHLAVLVAELEGVEDEYLYEHAMAAYRYAKGLVTALTGRRD